MTDPRHHLVYVPGLSDDHSLNRIVMLLLPTIWKWHGFRGHVVLPCWNDGGTFQPKLDKVLHVIDDLAAQGNLVSLVGQSAGGSAVISAFSERPDTITGVVNLTGRLRVTGRPSLADASKGSPAFAESVRRCEQALTSLTVDQRSRIMTIRPQRDTVVPAETVAIDGAQNRVSSVRGHSMGGAQLVSIGPASGLRSLSVLLAQR